MNSETQTTNNTRRQATRPIIFSGDNPKLILDGRKTQTRRIVNYDIDGESVMHFNYGKSEGTRCPYGKAGDRLWVRETWRVSEIWPDFHGRALTIQWKGDATEAYRYECDHEKLLIDDWKGKKGRWIPSIHMPRWASRITLEILTVRVERLRDISYEDCLAEAASIGVEACGCTEQEVYAKLWNSLHGKGTWDKNPWVWVIEFCLSLDEIGAQREREKTNI